MNPTLEKGVGAEEIAQWLNDLPYNHKDQRWDLQNPQEWRLAVISMSEGRDSISGQTLHLRDPASVRTEEEQLKMVPNTNFRAPHTCIAHTCMRTHIYTHKHAYNTCAKLEKEKESYSLRAGSAGTGPGWLIQRSPRSRKSQN